jgi:hypothetical protein
MSEWCKGWLGVHRLNWIEEEERSIQFGVWKNSTYELCLSSCVNNRKKHCLCPLSTHHNRQTLVVCFPFFLFFLFSSTWMALMCHLQVWVGGWWCRSLAYSVTCTWTCDMDCDWGRGCDQWDCILAHTGPCAQIGAFGFGEGVHHHNTGKLWGRGAGAPAGDKITYWRLEVCALRSCQNRNSAFCGWFV